MHYTWHKSSIRTSLPSTSGYERVQKPWTCKG